MRIFLLIASCFTIAIASGVRPSAAEDYSLPPAPDGMEWGPLGHAQTAGVEMDKVWVGYCRDVNNQIPITGTCIVSSEGGSQPLQNISVGPGPNGQWQWACVWQNATIGIVHALCANKPKHQK